MRLVVLDKLGVPIGDIDESEAGALPKGYRAEAPEETKLREYQDTAGVGETVKSFAEHAAGVGTFGLSDVALSEFGGEGYREQRALRDASNPIASTAGDIAGLFVPGGILKAGRAGLRALQGGTAAAQTATAAEAGGALRAGLSAGRTAAVDGAAFGAGAALSEAALAPGGDYDGLAEKVVTGAGVGAAAGMVAGFGLGTGGALFRKGAAKLGKGKAIDDATTDRGLSALGMGKREIKNLRMDSGEFVDGAARLGILTPGASFKGMHANATTARRAAGDAIGKHLDELDDVASRVGADDVLAPIDSEIRRLGLSPAKADRDAARALHEAATSARKAGTLTRAEVKALAARVEAHGGKNTAEAVRASLGAAPVVASLSTKEFAAGALKYAEELKGSLHGYEARFGERIEAEMSRLLQREKITYREAQEFRRGIDNAAKWGIDPASATTYGPHLTRVRNELESVIVSKGDEVAARAGDVAWSRSYGAAKKDFQIAATAEKALEGKATSGSSVLGLHETMAGATTFAATFDPDDPLGSVWKAGIAGAAAKGLRGARAGSFLASVMVKARTGEDAAKTAVRAFLRAPTRGAAVAAARSAVSVDRVLDKKDNETRGQAFTRRVAQLEAEQTAPPRLTSARLEMPETAKRLEAVQSRARQYLLDSAPRAPQPKGNPYGEHLTEPRPSDVAKWARLHDYVDRGPGGLLNDLRDGAVTREQAEAIRAVFPREYQRIAGEVTDQAAAGELTHAQRVQLGTVLGVPLTLGQTPGGRRLLAEAYAIQGQQQQSPKQVSAGSARGRVTPGAVDQLEGGAAA